MPLAVDDRAGGRDLDPSGVVEDGRGVDPAGDDRLEGLVDRPVDVGDAGLGDVEGEAGGGDNAGQDADAEDRLAGGRVGQGPGHEAQGLGAGVGELDQDHALERAALAAGLERLEEGAQGLVDAW